MQILLRRKNNALPDVEWDTIMKTQHHLDDFRARKQPPDPPPGDTLPGWEHIKLVAKGAREFSGSKEDIETVEGIMCRVSAAGRQTAQICCLHAQADHRSW
jgi:hypothetical protein